jgi:hypothetical protein
LSVLTSLLQATQQGRSCPPAAGPVVIITTDLIFPSPTTSTHLHALSCARTAHAFSWFCHARRLFLTDLILGGRDSRRGAIITNQVSGLALKNVDVKNAGVAPGRVTTAAIGCNGTATTVKITGGRMINFAGTSGAALIDVFHYAKGTALAITGPTFTANDAFFPLIRVSHQSSSAKTNLSISNIPKQTRGRLIPPHPPRTHALLPQGDEAQFTAHEIDCEVCKHHRQLPRGRPRSRL